MLMLCACWDWEERVEGAAAIGVLQYPRVLFTPRMFGARGTWGCEGERRPAGEGFSFLILA